MITMIQKHHIKYKEKDGEDWVVPVFRGEHYILTCIQRFCRKKVSKGFMTALEDFMEKRKSEAIEAV